MAGTLVTQVVLDEAKVEYDADLIFITTETDRARQMVGLRRFGEAPQIARALCQIEGIEGEDAITMQQLRSAVQEQEQTINTLAQARNTFETERDTARADASRYLLRMQEMEDRCATLDADLSECVAERDEARRRANEYAGWIRGLSSTADDISSRADTLNDLSESLREQAQGYYDQLEDFEVE